MTIATRFSRAYGIRYPIAAAGMGFVGSNSELAIAVAKAGCLGAVGVGMTPPAGVSAFMGQFRTEVTAPLNLNFITFLTSEEHIELCVEQRPEVVSFHWGHPSREWIDCLRDAGIKVWEQIGSSAAAKAALDDGIDLLVVQGTEAGGHNYAELPTFVAVPEVRRVVGAEPLLLAAGGICNGATLAAALALGADGAWIGSRLVASDEGNAHPDYKRAIVEASGEDTRLTSMFGRSMPHFNPLRVVANRVVREWEAREAEMPPEDDALPQIGTIGLGGQEVPLRRFNNFVPTREMRGDMQEMPLLAGQGIGQIDMVKPVAEIIEEMVKDAVDTIDYLSQARQS